MLPGWGVAKRNTVRENYQNQRGEALMCSLLPACIQGPFVAVLLSEDTDTTEAPE